MVRKPNEDTDPRVQRLFVGSYPERGMEPQGSAGAGLNVFCPGPLNLATVINETINRKILKVWQKHFGKSDGVYAPIFYDDFKPGGVLFIGVNPSLNPKGFRKVVRDTEFENLDPESFYRWSNIASNLKHIDICINIGRHVHAKYGFFKRMHEIGKAANMHLQHIDLFVYRQTKQKEFLPLVREDKKGKLNEFGRDQLDIFLEVLKSIRPVVIVVANASASKIVQEHFDRQITFDNERGFHWLMLNGSRVPIFFSSMLSGGGALDTGSYERLKWHIRQAAHEQPRAEAR